MVRTILDKVNIIFLYGECRTYRGTARRFNDFYPESPRIDHKYVADIVLKFRQTGSVKDRPRSGRKKVDEGTVIEIIGRVSTESQQSIREMSSDSDISYSTIRKVLKHYKFHPYKLHLVQSLDYEDFDRREQFCESLSEVIAQDDNYLKNVCFSDESCFTLHGQVNTHNVRYWANENPHIIREQQTQRPQKINVWAGIMGNHMVGPLFYEENLTGELYLQMLEDTINPLIIRMVENCVDDDGNREFDENKIVFQQDGCPAHFDRRVRALLDQNFPNSWIGRRGPREWCPRSPDLAPCDYFLWGYLKSVIYRTPPASLEDLKNRIKKACEDITPDTFEKVKCEFEARLYHCMGVNGQHFEQLIQ